MLVRVYEYSLEDFRYTGMNYEEEIDVPEGTNLFEMNWPDGRTHVKPPATTAPNEVPVFNPVSRKWSLEIFLPEYKYYLIDENGKLIDREPRYGKVGETIEYLSQFPNVLPPTNMVDPQWDGTKWVDQADLATVRKAKIKQLDAEYDARFFMGYETSVGYKVKITPTDFSMWQFGLQNLNMMVEQTKETLISQGMTEEEALATAKSQIKMPFIKDFNDVVHKDIPYDTYVTIVNEVSQYLNNLWMHKGELIAAIQESEDIDLIKSVTLDSDVSMFDTV